MYIDEKDPKSLFSWLVTSALSLMLMGNIYFIKRLVDKLDSTEQTVYALREEIARLKVQIDELQNQRGIYGDRPRNSQR